MTDEVPATTFGALSPDLTALALYAAIGLLLVAGMLLAAAWLGSGTKTANKHLPYESGVVPTGTAQFQFPVPFYLVAIFFIVFDVEAVFIFTWGVAWDLLGMPGLVHITFFIVVLLLGLVWLWKRGGLEWGRHKAAGHPHQR